MRSFCKLWLPVVAAFLTVFAPQTFAQINPDEAQGMKPYDTWHGGDLDSISVTNGALTLHIPLVSFPQRGSLDLSFMVSASNKQWYIKPAKFDSQGHVITPAQWLPLSNTGVQIVSSVDWWMNDSYANEPTDPNAPGEVLVDWSQSVSSPDGSSHTFGAQTGAQPNSPLYPMRSLDATGLLRPNAQTVILSNGTVYSYPTLTGQEPPGLLGLARFGRQASSVTDSNGNQITIGSNGWTDTLGRFIPGSESSAVVGIQPGVPTSDLSKCPSGTSSAMIWNVPGPANVNGGTRTFYFCYATFALSTSFGDGANDFSGSRVLLSAVVLPDLTMWTFSYDSYADVSQVNFPTGGSLSYTYALGAAAPTGSTYVSSRTLNANDGTGAHTWIYNYQTFWANGCCSFSQKGLTTVTGPPTASSPQGDDVAYTVGPGVAGSGCPAYVYQTQYFQGRSSSGTLLKTVQTQYNCSLTVNGGPLSNVALNVVPIQQTVIWPTGQTSTVINTYDQPFNDPNGQAVRIGSLLEKDEYDFTNTLVRSTFNQYLWQNDTTYLTDNFVSLVNSSTLKDGTGNQIAQTTYNYDQYASGTPTPSGITTGLVAPPAGEPIRGNRTTTSHWLNTSNSLLSSTATYFDTGMLASSTPPANADGLNRTTTYTYSSTFFGAYVTQTNTPDTQMPDSGAPVVHHVISGNYDLNTGMLTSFTDENSQVYSYQYDIMLRMTQGIHPDQGQTLFSYPDPNTVVRQTLISGSTYDSFTAKFDGLGRNYETLQAVPGATVEVDTTFDSLGRVATVSNPYFQGTSHSGDPTYGVTQTQYDALSRVVKAIKQDNSSSSVQYNAPAGDGQGSNVVCTTAIDEAGKQRQVCSDGLGRMVKVIEPNPGSVSTNATGWVAVSGSEQTANSQPATSGTFDGITISGTDQTACARYSGGKCTITVHDQGTVSITVNGHQTSQSYGNQDDPTLASNVASAINSDSGAFVNASASGSTITLTARATGASTNYSFSTSSATGDTNCIYFCSPSFTASPASGALSGGRNASSTPDTGTVTVTINGTNYQVSYGASDSASTIASNLAAAISTGSLANASASGATISLTSKTAGTVGDYSLSTSYTWNNGQFTNPSFTTSTSGAAMTGALDGGAVNNNPFVTTYQYNARGDMLCVHQKATDTTPDVACTGTAPPSVSSSWRQRFFTYDSLSRLQSAMNPETNSTGNTQITYTYDADSNVISKTEPAPNVGWGSSQTVGMTYTYDALNRLLNTTFSDGVTPNTAHRYDYSSYLGQSFSYPIGREVAATSANGAQYFTSYEQMGRIARTVECIPGVANCQAFSALYDKLGDLTTLNYPSNSFTVTYGYDSAARLTSATDSNGVTYAQNPTFLASGSMQEFTSPNFNNNKYHVDFNNRLQPTEIWAGAAEGANALFDKQYQYNAPNTSQMNNGNIYTVTNVRDSTRTQTFTYDYLNRLTSGGDQTHWYNSYTYDAWGNLTQKTKGGLPGGENLSTSATANNQLVGYSYDSAGNMLTDGINGWTYVYDSGNRITTAGSTSYTYDAGGRRVRKSSGTNYWYGPSGSVLAETDSSGNWTNYVFFGGQRLARNVSGNINYYVTDHLHSTAVFASNTGTVLDDNDFYPWGGAVPGVGQTTSNNTVKFTGKYRDSETQLDYFGARYYENATGRFMTPDWDGKPTTVPYAVFGDPQSLNLYSYVRDSPVVRVDADGHDGMLRRPRGGVDDGGGGMSDPFNVTWTRAMIITTVTDPNFGTHTYVHPGDVAVSGLGAWQNQTTTTRQVQFTPPTNPRPVACNGVTADDLQYDTPTPWTRSDGTHDTGGEHIYKYHIVGDPKDNSIYKAEYPVPTPAPLMLPHVINLNQITFDFGDAAQKGGPKSNITFTYTFTEYPYRVPMLDGSWATVVGFGTLPGGGNAVTNKLVLDSACRLVVTSYGIP